MVRKSRRHFIYVLFLIVIMVLSVYFAYYFYSIRYISARKVTLTESSSIYYSVKVTDEKQYGYNNNQTSYISSLIKEVNPYFNYNLKFDSDVKGKYGYYLTGTIKSYDNKGKNLILDKRIVSTDKVEFDVNSDTINLNNKFKIDYEKIYKDYKEFYETNKDVIENYYIEYVVNIYYNVYSTELEKDINETKKINLTLDVNDVLNIATDKKETVQRDINNVNKNELNKLYVALSFEFMCITGLCFFLTILVIIKNEKIQHMLAYKVEKLMKKYDRNIVRIKTLPDLTNLEVLFVDNFQDLLDASKTLNSPINAIDVIKNKEVTFIVINKKMAYVYKINQKNIDII